MNSSTANPAYQRDRGLDFIRKGKEIFNDAKLIPEKEKGYEVYKKGLEYMFNYAKIEKDQDLVKKIKENMAGWLKEAKQMEQTIQSDQDKIKPSGGNDKIIEEPSSKQTTKKIEAPRDEDAKDHKDSSPTKTEPKKLKEKGDDDDDKMMGTLKAAIVTEKPNVKWDDIAGLETAKKALQEAVILPIKFPDLFVGMRTPWKGILLYGPPGTGKTYLAKACATEADGTFFSISSSDVISKYVGESEKLIKTLFKLARESKPAIIFIDEIDSMLSARSDNENEASRRVKTEFLVQMQGVGHDDTGILVLGATNIPWALDSAVRRRFEKRIYIPLPDVPAREALLRKQLGKTPNELCDDDVVYLAERSEGYSCADLNILIRDACFQPLRKAQNATHFKVVKKNAQGKDVYTPCPPSDPNGALRKMLDIPGDQLTLPNVSIDDFETALMKTKPSVSNEDLTNHIEFTKNFGVEG